MHGSVAEGGGRVAASGLRLEGRLRSMLTVMLGGDLDVATRVQTWILRPRPLRLGLGFFEFDPAVRVRVKGRLAGLRTRSNRPSTGLVDVCRMS